MTRESEDLATHVEICAIRYEAINEKFEAVDATLSRIDSGLTDIKHLIADQQDSKFATMVTTAGTVIVALLGVMGYLIARMS